MRAVRQHAPVGHEQQRLGVVGLVELLAGQQGAVEAAGLREVSSAPIIVGTGP